MLPVMPVPQLRTVSSDHRRVLKQVAVGLANEYMPDIQALVTPATDGLHDDGHDDGRARPLLPEAAAAVLSQQQRANQHDAPQTRMRIGAQQRPLTAGPHRPGSAGRGHPRSAIKQRPSSAGRVRQVDVVSELEQPAWTTFSGYGGHHTYQGLIPGLPPGKRILLDLR
jgi:hypothetical protein